MARIVRTRFAGAAVLCVLVVLGAAAPYEPARNRRPVPPRARTGAGACRRDQCGQRQASGIADASARSWCGSSRRRSVRDLRSRRSRFARSPDDAASYQESRYRAASSWLEARGVTIEPSTFAATAIAAGVPASRIEAVAFSVGDLDAAVQWIDAKGERPVRPDGGHRPLSGVAGSRRRDHS